MLVNFSQRINFIFMHYSYCANAFLLFFSHFLCHLTETLWQDYFLLVLLLLFCQKHFQVFQSLQEYRIYLKSWFKSRYYATFKVRKFKSFCKINTFLEKTTACTRLQTEQIFSVNINYTYFGWGFCASFSLSLPNTPASCGKKYWYNFCCIEFLFVWTQKLCLRFLKSVFKLEILIFLSFVVPVLVDMFN